MIGRLDVVVIDCPDPLALAQFYAAVLGEPITRQDTDWVTVGDNRLAFQLAPDLQPPKWPDASRPQQFHLDIAVEDIDAAEAQILALGATRLSPGEPGFRVYADPAGHPFCLVYQ